MAQDKTTLLSCLSLPLFVSREDGYDSKWSVISCSSIWLLNCRHMCCQLLPFLSLFSPPPLLSLSRSLFTRFRGFQTSTFPKIRHSRTPTFSHPVARLFQILPQKLAHSLPSVSEQNIAHFSFVLDIYQLIFLFQLFFQASVLPAKNACEKCLRLTRKRCHSLNSHLIKHFKHLNEWMFTVNECHFQLRDQLLNMDI